MCLYTYHHYPAGGHIANWTVTSCKEYTNALRLLSRAGLSGSCNQIQTTHDLLPSLESNLCSQCDLELSRAASDHIFDGQWSKTYRTIEGLDFKSPVVEISARMNLDVNDEEVAGCSCDCCSCFTPPFSTEESNSSGVSPDGNIPFPALVAKVSQYLNNLEDSDDFSMDHGGQLDFLFQAPRSKEENAADIRKILRQASSVEDISPSWTQLNARTSRNSLHGAIIIGIDRAIHSPERRNTEYPSTWFDPSDDEQELTFFDDSDDIFFSGDESQVQNSGSLTFLDNDSDADDESDGGCELTDNFDDDYADMLSPLPLSLVSNKANIPLLMRESASVLDRPPTTMPCPEPLRVSKPAQFLSLDAVLGEIFDENAPELVYHNDFWRLM